MKSSPERIIKIYLALTLFSTLAASFIWGVNTLFLLDAGLSITGAFAANALFTPCPAMECPRATPCRVRRRC